MKPIFFLACLKYSYVTSILRTAVCIQGHTSLRIDAYKHTHICEHFFVHSQIAFPLQWSLYNCLLDYAAFTIFIFTLEYIKIQKLSVCHSSTYNCNICLLRKLQNILLEWNYPLIQFDTHTKKWFHLLSCKIDSFNIVLHSIYLLTRQG